MKVEIFEDSILRNKGIIMEDKVFKNNNNNNSYTMSKYQNKKSGHESQESVRNTRYKYNSMGFHSLPSKGYLGKRKQQILQQERISSKNLQYDEQAYEGMEDEFYDQDQVNSEQPPTKRQKLNNNNNNSKKRKRKVSWAPNVKTKDSTPGAYIKYLKTKIKKKRKQQKKNKLNNDCNYDDYFVGRPVYNLNDELFVLNKQTGSRGSDHKKEMDHSDNDDDDIEPELSYVLFIYYLDNYFHLYYIFR